MIVDVEVWYWTEVGMHTRGVGEGYVTRRDCERLLEEADARRLNQERERRDEEIERRRDTGEP